MGKKKKYSVVSLFSGCGGLDLGFVGGFSYIGKRYSTLDFHLEWANDIDAPSCLTFEKNFGEKIICGDIREILKKGSLPKKTDVVLGGFPCQDFSLAGKRRGFNSQRGLLYQSMKEVIKRTRPLLFVAENVKGLLTSKTPDGKRVVDVIHKDFSSLGYNVVRHLYYAAKYGVPQSRERVIFIGTDKKRSLPPFKHPEPILDEEHFVTLEKAIGDLEKVKEGAAPNHYWSRAKMFVGTQGNSVILRDKIGPTMRAEHHGNIEWHWNRKRRLSAREAARIQSFPDSFVFYPSTSSAYKQIGNAVPPVMAWHIAKAVERFLNDNVK